MNFTNKLLSCEPSILSLEPTYKYTDINLNTKLIFAHLIRNLMGRLFEKVIERLFHMLMTEFLRTVK